MDDDATNPLDRPSEGKRARFEVRTILLIVLAVIVLGGLYVAVFGSPARSRRDVDSTNYNPFPPNVMSTQPPGPDQTLRDKHTSQKPR